LLSLVLQTIESSFGSGLAAVAAGAFWIGMAMVIYVIAVPVARVAIDFSAANIGLARHWVMQCPTCKQTIVVSGGDCERCGKALGIPLAVRIRNFFSPEIEADWWRYLRWGWTMLGTAAFALVTVTVLVTTGAWHPQAHVEKLFVGLALLTWAGLGWLMGRVAGMNTGGPLSRLRDGIFALASAAVLALLVIAADAARPVAETVLARITVQGQAAQINGRHVPLVGYQFGFEYLQLDHPLLGYQQIIPMAVIGSASIPLLEDGWRKKVVDHFWSHASGYTARGLAVRRRTELFLTPQPGVYDVVLRGREIGVQAYLLPNDG
jgi:hypothetical protein